MSARKLAAWAIVGTLVLTLLIVIVVCAFLEPWSLLVPGFLLALWAFLWAMEQLSDDQEFWH